MRKSHLTIRGWVVMACLSCLAAWLLAELVAR